MAYFNGTTWVSQAPTTTKSTGSSKSSGSNIVSQQMNQIKNQNVTKANQAVANSASKKTNNSSLTSSGQKAEQLSRNTSSGTSQAAQRMADSVQQSINANKATQNPVNPVVTPVVEEAETPSYDFNSIINSAYDAQKSAADAYMDNIRKYANQAYDENKRNSYAGLRAIERALGKRSSPFGGTEQWTLGKAYNSYNNALSGFDKTRQQALDTGNVNYLSQLATAEGNKTDRLLKLLMQ